MIKKTKLNVVLMIYLRTTFCNFMLRQRIVCNKIFLERRRERVTKSK